MVCCGFQMVYKHELTLVRQEMARSVQTRRQARPQYHRETAAQPGLSRLSSTFSVLLTRHKMSCKRQKHCTRCYFRDRAIRVHAEGRWEKRTLQILPKTTVLTLSPVTEIQEQMLGQLGSSVTIPVVEEEAVRWNVKFVKVVRDSQMLRASVQNSFCASWTTNVAFGKAGTCESLMDSLVPAELQVNCFQKCQTQKSMLTLICWIVCSWGVALPNRRRWQSWRMLLKVTVDFPEVNTDSPSHLYCQCGSRFIWCRKPTWCRQCDDIRTHQLKPMRIQSLLSGSS